MKESGIDHIDEELSKLKSSFQSIIKSFELLNEKSNISEEAKNLKRALNDFRYKLAYNRGTEHYETKYGWTNEFENMCNKLDTVIDSTKKDTST